MKAISLWQPWASAIACGSKTIETRHWSTKYRGPLAIHAAKHFDKEELIYFASCWHWCGALEPIGLKMGGKNSIIDLLPFGAIVAVCNLSACHSTGSLLNQFLNEKRYPKRGGESCAWTENSMGDFSLGRFGWILKDIKPLKKPYLFKGSQGLFEVPDFITKYL